VGENRSIHDAAWSCATFLVEKLEPVFMPTELRDAHELIFDAVRAAIEAAFIARARELQRLQPSRN
jgi:hypothetical protein